MKRTLLLSAFLCLVLTGQCFANALLLESTGPVAYGRAGINVSQTDNNVLIHDNPAALTEFKGKTLEIGLDETFINPSFQNAANGESLGNVVCNLPSLSYTQKVNDTLGFGVGMFVPAGVQTDYMLNDPTFGLQENSSCIVFQKLLVAAAWKPCPSLSLGAGIGGSYGRMKLKEPYTFQTGTLQGVPILMDMKADDMGFTWNVGLQWRPMDGTTIGLAYQPRHKFNLEGHARMDLGIVGTLMGFPDTGNYYDVEADLVWPQNVAVGVTQKVTEALRVSAELKWFDWSSAFDQLTFKLSHGYNPTYDAVATATPQDTLQLQWDDSYSLAVGLDYDITKNDTVRAGYVYTQNPIPADTQTQLIPAVMSHQVHVGYGHNWQNLSLNCAYAYAFGSQDAQTSKILPATEYDNNQIDINVQVLSIGAQYRF